MRHQLIKTAIFSVLLISAFPVLTWPVAAQSDSGWYPLYISYGYGESDYKDATPVSQNYKIDEEHEVQEFVIGIPLSESFGLEAGYVQLGENELSNISANNIALTLGERQLGLSPNSVYREDITGITGGLRYTYPVNEKIDLYARAGVIHWETETSVSGNVTLAGTPIVNGLQDDGTGGYYGIGARFNFSETVGLGLEYIRYDEVADREIDAIYTRLDIKFDTPAPVPSVR